MWWHSPAIPALGRLTREDHCQEFVGNLKPTWTTYRDCLKKPKNPFHTEGRVGTDSKAGPALSDTGIINPNQLPLTDKIVWGEFCSSISTQGLFVS